MILGIAHLQPIVSLIAGILILIVPRLLNYIVAIFLIVSGVIGLCLLEIAGCQRRLHGRPDFAVRTKSRYFGVELTFPMAGPTVQEKP